MGKIKKHLSSTYELAGSPRRSLRIVGGSISTLGLASALYLGIPNSAQPVSGAPSNECQPVATAYGYVDPALTDPNCVNQSRSNAVTSSGENGIDGQQLILDGFALMVAGGMIAAGAYRRKELPSAVARRVEEQVFNGDSMQHLMSQLPDAPQGRANY